MKKLIVLSLCLISILSVGMVSTKASVKSGTSWQTAEYENIPPYGKTKYNLSQGTKKTTTSKKGSMKASYGAILSPYARFITSGKKDRSNASCVKQSVTHPKLYSTVDKGDTLYTKMSTNSLDPGYIEVTLKFTADYID